MISAVVLTKNEQKNIKDCLKTLQRCDEIVVVDDYSTDKTVTIAKKLGVRIFRRSLNDDFANQRNFGLQQAKGDWVLFVDADERISAPLVAEIQHQVFCPAGRRASVKYQGFYLKRKDFFGGRWLKHGETAKVKLLRLAKKGAGVWRRQVHEVWEVKGKIGELKNPIFHYPHQTISEFLNHLDFHSTLHAEALLAEGVQPSFFRIVANPLAKFLQNWLFRLGFLDGEPGLIVALMMSFHSFLTRARLWLLWQKK